MVRNSLVRVVWQKLNGLCQRVASAKRLFGSSVYRSAAIAARKKQELNMNDLIVYAGIGILLIGLPVLAARMRTNKR